MRTVVETGALIATVILCILFIVAMALASPTHTCSLVNCSEPELTALFPSPTCPVPVCPPQDCRRGEHEVARKCRPVRGGGLRCRVVVVLPAP